MLLFGAKPNFYIRSSSPVRLLPPRRVFDASAFGLEYAGHARDFVQEMDLSECGGIVVASGDGLVYEVINGLMSRRDWQEALKLPIGHLPCGSGNAFVTNIALHSK